MGLQVSDFTEHSWQSLISYDWPGNVREFKNVIEAAMVQIPYPRMRLIELPDRYHQQFAPPIARPTEYDTLIAALTCHDWNKSKAAQQLRWSRMTLCRKMAKYQLSSSDKAQVRTA
jgi:transcriptional regulator of acetoin/glycerol metabolism